MMCPLTMSGSGGHSMAARVNKDALAKVLNPQLHDMS